MNTNQPDRESLTAQHLFYAKQAVIAMEKAIRKDNNNPQGILEITSVPLILLLLDVSNQEFERSSKLTITQLIRILEDSSREEKWDLGLVPVVTTELGTDKQSQEPRVKQRGLLINDLLNSRRYSSNSTANFDRAAGLFQASKGLYPHIINEVGIKEYKRQEDLYTVSKLKKEPWRLCFFMGDSELLWYVSDVHVTNDTIDWTTRAYSWTDGSSGPNVSLKDKSGKEVELDIVPVHEQEDRKTLSSLLDEINPSRPKKIRN